MKSFIYIPFALLLGLLVGSWSPRAEIATLKKELASSRELLKKQPKRKPSISEVTSLLGIERTASSEADKPESQIDPVAVTSEKTAEAAGKDEDAAIKTDGGSAEELEAKADEEPAEQEEPRERTREDMEAEIERAAELWRMRVNVARSTFISNNGLNDQQAMQFDQLVDNMNLKIGATIDLFAENLEDAEEVHMEAGIRVMNDITDSIVATYDEMDDSMPEGWRRNTGDNFSLVNFIDPEVGRPLIGLEDKLEQMDGGQDQRE